MKKISQYLYRWLKKTKTIIIEQDAFLPLWFVLSATEFTEFNALECCNFFYESNLFQAAEPDLMFENMLLSVPDMFFPDQWGLQNTGQYLGIPEIDIKAEPAWLFSTGEGVIVAVIDEGIEFTHPDLSDNIHPFIPATPFFF